jgi:predicted lipid-binding transport protein (Tim44 family)
MTTGASPLAGGGKRLARALGAGLKAALMLAVRRPAVVFGTAVVLAVGAAVALNALAWQTARHPAPLFPRNEPALRRPVVVPAPLPPARPPEVAPPAAAPMPAPAAVPAPAPAPSPAKPAGRDPIGDLIRGVDPAAVAAKDASKIAAAQRALTKLGYATLKSDGVIGPGTRQAIEKFERERRLPATGELGPRTVRELSAQAGMPIE